MEQLSERLLQAVGSDRPFAGIEATTEYIPAGADKVFPPTFPTTSEEEPVYLFEERRIDGEDTRVVVLDQVPSQANRVEAALLRARDEGRIDLPLFELTAQASDGIPVRLTSLEFPHRFADAYLRDAQLDGAKFDQSEPGRRLRSVTPADLSPLFELSPESLLFGSWDSHRKGRGVKVARSYSSSIIGLAPKEGRRKSGRMDPLNLTGEAKADGDSWEFAVPGEKKGPKKEGSKLSERGHGNIAPNPAHGGVAITGARRHGWISLAGLDNMRFGKASPEACVLARATLAALALAGDRLAFAAPSLWLRSGCDLVRTRHEVALIAPGGPEPVEINAEQAIEAFTELRERTAQAGLVMSTDTIALTPQKNLAKAIDYALTRAEPGEAE
ncbi:type I-G CRISPR-associated RAMP protein Csb1/Cas7g [Nocardiopsis baichengensis]|uniref:type I-G CRISPR-associated RAMP protein Csb1/Cas7g n=1 Tax=Nocardiopsis baichengensis TaxID=280240 RepID=UPI00034B5513|nr:type I-U CRISPR-associated RAMP protein Csb1/Cas7u [Nocardiopsis baichengensis]